ncbi:MAG: glycosyltransferase family A protein [Comamonas sp.]|uniref:glycosyltransferase family 2 protein n=1 Tax=Comamonas sp. TaxID=34028 RepID=UPI002FC5D7E4
MSTPQISCIIPVYNGQDHLERAVHSVLSQNHVDMEVLLIDDFSPQQQARDCAAALAHSDRRVRTFFLPDNGGQSRARNLGAVLARAPLLSFLDQDDEHAQDWYGQASQLMQQHPDTGALSGEAQVVDLPPRLGIQEGDLRIKGLSHVFITNLICRRSVFLASGGFPMAEHWRTHAAGEDGHFRALFSKHWKGLRCNIPALIHHAREGGATVYFLDRSRVENNRVVVELNDWETSGTFQQAADQHIQAVDAAMQEIRLCLNPSSILASLQPDAANSSAN